MAREIYPGQYSLAVIVSTVNEEGKVKVRIPEFHGPFKADDTNSETGTIKVSYDDLPWASFCYPLGQPAPNVTVNEVVYVTYPDRNLEFPLIIGTTGQMMNEKDTGLVSTPGSEGMSYYPPNTPINLTGAKTGEEVARVALSHVGQNGTSSGTFAFYGGQNHWCAMFAVYCVTTVCGKENGNFEGSTWKESGHYYMPPSAGCGIQGRSFNSKGLWRPPSYTPRPGDMMYINWSGTGSLNNLDHVEVVASVSGSSIVTVGGNTKAGSNYMASIVSKRDWIKGSANYNKWVVGYGTPVYPERS